MSTIQEDIGKLKDKAKAVVLAHTYQPGEIQDIADYVGDSYGLSVEASKAKAEVILFCGVRFMAETAAILNPKSKVILPVRDAGCPMAEMITPDELLELKRQYPGYLVMCYVNSTAEIKALSDVCCTSSNAVAIANKLPKSKGIIFVPDRHLGSYVQEQTGRRMVMWDGFCPTHMRIDTNSIEKARREHPKAVMMIHPEAKKICRDLSDKVLSTGGMLEYARKSRHKEFIIATETGIIHALQKENPAKKFHPLSGLVLCPNMKKTTLEIVKSALEGKAGDVVKVPEEIASKAKGALKKMLDLSE